MVSRGGINGNRPARAIAVAPFALLAIAGVLMVVVAFTADGISIGGNVCGGAGAAQRCLHVDKPLRMGTQFGWFSVALLVVGAALTSLGVIGTVARSLRLWLGLAAAAVAAVAMVGAEHVDSRFCPGEPGGATCGRSDEAWGPVLRPRLLELRAVERRRHVGEPVEAGGPAAEAGLTFDTFRASPLGGWTWIRRLVIAAWFVALTQLVASLLRPAWVAVLAVPTVGGSVWAAIADRMHPCAEGASDCYQGLLTAFALVASTLVWGIALALAWIVRVWPRRRG